MATRMTYRAIAVTGLTVLAALGATAGAEAKTTLSLSSATVSAGEALRITGTGWPKRRGISLYLRPVGDVRHRVAIVRTDGRGRFRRSIRIAAGAPAGRYAVTACTTRCRRARTVRLSVLGPGTVVAPPPPLLPGTPPTASAPAPPSTPAAVAELERRIKNTKLVRSDSVGSCTVACDPSQTTVVFCADATWTLDSKSSGGASGGAYNLRWGGTWRVLSAATAGDGSVRGEVGLRTLSKGADSGSEMKAPIAFGAPGSSQVTFNGLAYTAGPGCG